MSVQNAYCCYNKSRNCALPNPCARSTWYCRILKPVAFLVITALLAMSVSHLCDKYSANSSFKSIKADLGNLRSHLSTLSLEVKSVMETRNDLKNKLKELGIVIPKMSEAILKLRNDVSEGRIISMPTDSFSTPDSEGDISEYPGDVATMGLHTNTLLKALSPESVRDMVRCELETYDADKTGRTDYALETSGGAILSTRNTETYSAGAPVLTLFGIPLCQQQNTPRAVIQSGVLPGECWAFKGSTGAIVIQLLGPIYVSGISLEHISPSISPTGETSAAPKDFTIWGLRSIADREGFLFGEFRYDTNGYPVQYFEVQHKSKFCYEIIELKVHSNNGNYEYTCIYRIRVHGSLNR